MSVADNPIKEKYDCNGSTVNFPITFQYVLNTQIKVKHVSALLVITDLILDDAGADGFSIVSDEVVTVSTYPTDDDIWVIRETSLTQTTVRKNNRRTPASVDDDSFDKLTHQTQENQEEISRSLRFPITDVSGISAELPIPVAKKGIRISDDGLSIVLTDDDLDDQIATVAASAAAAAASAVDSSGFADDAEADAVLTAADVVTTAADVVSTAADVVSTGDDVVAAQAILDAFPDFEATGDNSGFGNFALDAITTGVRNSASGYESGTDVEDGTENSFFGAFAGNNMVSGIGNNFMGAYSGRYATGNFNLGSGAYSLDALTTGERNVGVGAHSLGSITDKWYNTGLGHEAGFSCNGHANLFLGYKAGYSYTGDSTLWIARDDDGGTYANTWIYGDSAYNIHIKNGNLILTNTYTPGHAGATGIEGQVAWDADYLYICTATDTWKRVAVATW